LICSEKRGYAEIIPMAAFVRGNKHGRLMEAQQGFQPNISILFDPIGHSNDCPWSRSLLSDIENYGG
jgi:hypothetical protein